jgi:hypothetical protein
MVEDVHDKLEAILAEYNGLRTEISDRQDFELRFMQFHIIALTSIIGFAFYQELKLWALMLIPIESSIIGAWCLKNEVAVTEIGKYIYAIENKVNALLNDNQMGWQHNLETLGKRRKSFRAFGLIPIIFMGPSIIILTIIPLIGFLSYNVSYVIAFGWVIGASLLYYYIRNYIEYKEAITGNKED